VLWKVEKFTVAVPGLDDEIVTLIGFTLTLGGELNCGDTKTVSVMVPEKL
jgi:hypothetical protein